MKRITVITGYEKSGKTFLAKNISLAFEKVTWLEGRGLWERIQNLSFPFQDLDENTDLIIIDDLQGGYLEDVAFYFSQNYITVNRPLQKALQITPPNLIITVCGNISLHESLSRRTNVIGTAITKGPIGKPNQTFHYKKLDL